MLIIDGTYLVYKSFYRTKKNIPEEFNDNMDIFYKSVRNSFLKIVSSLKNRFNPNELLIVFDCEGDNFRHRLLPSYKSNRKEKPVELLPIKNEIYSFLEKHNFVFQISKDCEADDLIASYVHSNPNKKISIFTGDADLGALVSKNTTLLLEKSQKIKNSNNSKQVINLVTDSNFHHFFQVPPSRLAEFKALQGDKSDYVKGVDGLFRSETVHLLMEYPSIEEFFENGQSHYLFSKLINHKNKILTNLSVTKMKYDCPMEFKEESLAISNISLSHSIMNKIKW